MTNINHIVPVGSVCIVTGRYIFFTMQPLEPQQNMLLCRRHILPQMSGQAIPPLWELWPFPPSSPQAPVEGMALAALFIYLFTYLFRAAPATYGNSQARSLRGATAAGLRHSYGNMGSKPLLRPTPELMATPDP